MYMQPRALKYLLDIETVIAEIESFKALIDNDYEKYCNNLVVKRATERDLEIIGEAVKNLLQVQPDIQIQSSRKIIGLRNLISHAYDTVEDELIWGIIQKDIPRLAAEVEVIKNSWGKQ
jgi:uncharacterized protein with HEPN domain